MDMDLSLSDSFINENDENVILSGETVVVGNITIWELAGIFLITSVILSKLKITKIIFLILFKIEFFKSFYPPGTTQAY